MMNQAASATRRPAGSTAPNGCCPMFNTPFFMNTFTPQAAPLIPPPVANHCFLGPQAPQIQLPTNQPVQQRQNATVLPPPPSTISIQQQSSGAPSNGPTNNNTTPHRQQAHQAQPSRLHDPSSTPNHSTSAPLTAPGLALQQLLAARHSASNCMALAAALASASFPHFQQLQQAQQQQIHQSTPINQSTSTSNSSNPVPTAPPLNVNATPSNQVPLLNFNSYNTAQPYLSSQAPSSTPAAAHLNAQPNGPPILRNNVNTGHLHQQQQLTSNQTASTNQTSVQATPASNANGNVALDQQHRQPLTTNNTAGQPTNYRLNAPAAANASGPPTQQLGQGARNILNDETLNSLLNDQFQAILLNQLFANNQFAPPVNVPAPMQHQQTSANSDRPLQPQQAAPGPNPINSASTQPVPASVSHQPAPQPSTQEQVSGQHQAFQPQARLNQVPDGFISSGAPNAATVGSAYQSQQNANPLNNQHIQHHQAASETVNQFQAQQPLQQQGAPQTQQQQQQQQQQPQQQPQPIHPMPFYGFPQVEQALALLTNPQVANNIFSHVFNIYFQSGMRTEPHTHHHHHAPHHFHHHLHGTHHHHGPNGQGNGQDVTVPLDSLAISESKPRGLNRAEIDSLTPYIHMNEKDSRTCVICLSKFELKSKIRPLPCNHAFHAKCVDKWLRANRTCPICRRDALKTYGSKLKRV